MARIVILREWPDGDVLRVIVDVAASYPDALSEAKATALATYADALGLTLRGNE